MRSLVDVDKLVGIKNANDGIHTKFHELKKLPSAPPLSPPIQHPSEKNASGIVRDAAAPPPSPPIQHSSEAKASARCSIM